MKAPNLSRLVTIQRPVATQESTYGTSQVTWTALETHCRAEVLDEIPSRSERVQSGLQVAANRARLRMRWRDDIDSTMRVIVHGDTERTYSIIAGPAEIGGRKAFMEFVIERYSTAGTAP